MTNYNLLHNKRLSVHSLPPYDPLQAFVRDNHIALKGMEEGPLSDLVFAAKDVFKITGSTWGNGHPEWLSTSSPDDFTASTIKNLLESGADLVGKTVCDELCFSISGENWHYGSPLNPHDARRLTGGSSSGTCAATAGGLVDFAIGSDCLGSVRVPASYNGLLGMRPTYRRVPTDGEAPYCESMDVLGFVANDPTVFKQVAKELLKEDPENSSFTKLLIATDCFNIIDHEVKTSLEKAVQFVGENVGTVEEVVLAPEGLDEWAKTFRIVQGYEVWQSYGGFINKYQPRLSPGPKERLQWASKISLQEYYEAYKKMKEIKEHLEKIISPGDLLILPTVSSIAPLKSAPHDEITYLRKQSSELLCISPLAGIPQVTIPLATQYNMPLGISLIGANNTDLELANFGANLVEKFKNHVAN